MKLLSMPSSTSLLTLRFRRMGLSHPARHPYPRVVIVGKHADVAYLNQTEVNGISVEQQFVVAVFYDAVVLYHRGLLAVALFIEAAYHGVEFLVVNRF